MRAAFMAGAFCALAAAASRDYKFEAREPVHHTFAKNTTLDIDLVSGSINVIGDGGDNIRVDGEKVMRAATQEELERAKKEVVLDANEKAGTAQLYANGPFRNNSHASENHGFHEHDDRRYDVAFNLTAHVPRAMALRLRNVNGEVKTEGTAGAFDVSAVNGPITMTSIAGSGIVSTVNGPLIASFRENPKADSHFKTLNGKLDVSFQPGLNANMAFKTLNGQAYTDFESVALASAPGTAELRNGKRVFRTNDFRNVQVGAGGPELKFETLNGDIRVARQAR